MRLAGIAHAFWMRRGVLAPSCALLVYLLLMVISTHLPPSGLRPFAFALQFQLSDKLAHAGAYGGLTLLAMAVWRTHRRAGMSFQQKLSAVAGICLVLACWGLVDEFTQPYFGRQFDWFDWMANLTGISLAVAASALIPRTTRPGWLVAFSMR